MKEERQRLRLFVCMKTRTDGRSCCAHSRRWRMGCAAVAKVLTNRSGRQLGPIANVFVPLKVVGLVESDLSSLPRKKKIK